MLLGDIKAVLLPTLLESRVRRLAVIVVAVGGSLVVAACGGGGGSKTATPALSAEEASTATAFADATGTAEAGEAARATAAAGYAALKIKSAEITTGATPDPVSTMPTFIVHMILDNQTGNAARFVGEFVIRLANGTEVTYGSYQCSKVIVIEAPEGAADVTTQACAGDRGTPIAVPDALSLAQGATLVRERLIFEGDVATPWYTPSGSPAET